MNDKGNNSLLSTDSIFFFYYLVCCGFQYTRLIDFNVVFDRCHNDRRGERSHGSTKGSLTSMRLTPCEQAEFKNNCAYQFPSPRDLRNYEFRGHRPLFLASRNKGRAYYWYSGTRARIRPTLRVLFLFILSHSCWTLRLEYFRRLL